MLTKAILLQVQAMKKSHMNQIRVCHYGGELFLEIYKSLELDLIRPIGWVSGSLIPGIPETREAWLIFYKNNYYWVQAPMNRLGPDRKWMQESWIVDLPQLFVS